MDNTFKVKYRKSGSSKWKDTTMTIHGTYAECPECKQNLVDPIQFNVLHEIRINNISDQKVKAKQDKDRSFGLECKGKVYHFTSPQRNEILLDILSHCPQNKINHEHLKTIQSSTGIQMMEIDQDGDCEYDHVIRVSHDIEKGFNYLPFPPKVALHDPDRDHRMAKELHMIRFESLPVVHGSDLEGRQEALLSVLETSPQEEAQIDGDYRHRREVHRREVHRKREKSDDDCKIC